MRSSQNHDLTGRLQSRTDSWTAIHRRRVAISASGSQRMCAMEGLVNVAKQARRAPTSDVADGDDSRVLVSDMRLAGLVHAVVLPAGLGAVRIRSQRSRRNTVGVLTVLAVITNMPAGMDFHDAEASL